MQLIYQADVTNNVDDECKYYLGLTKTTFREQFNDHKRSLRNESKRTSTEFLKYVWLVITAKNAVISPDFLVWKFYEKAQFPHQEIR